MYELEAQAERILQRLICILSIINPCITEEKTVKLFYKSAHFLNSYSLITTHAA